MGRLTARRPVVKTPGKWAEREEFWARELPRLRLGAEPIADQLKRLRRTTWALTIVPAIIGVMFVALFWAFGSPALGLAVASVILGPMVVLAWLEYCSIRRRAARYESERRAWLQQDE